MTTPSLIEFLEARKAQIDEISEGNADALGKSAGLAEAIAIVRNHEANMYTNSPISLQVNETCKQTSHVVTDVEISNMLHRLNLDRPDLAALPEGSTIACNITTLRQAADLIKRLAARAVSEVAGCEAARAENSSCNNEITMPVGSNARTSRAPASEVSGNNELGCAKEPKTVAAAPASNEGGMGAMERVAIALCPWFNGSKDDRAPQEVWDDTLERFKSAYREQAKAAICTDGSRSFRPAGEVSTAEEERMSLDTLGMAALSVMLVMGIGGSVVGVAMLMWTIFRRGSC